MNGENWLSLRSNRVQAQDFRRTILDEEYMEYYTSNY
jgi:hypothetical protein